MLRGERLLTDLGLKKLAASAGRHADGGGLFLKVDDHKAKGKDVPTRRQRWVYRFTLNGREHGMGLGAYPAVGLAMARSRRDAARRTVQSGGDPIAERKAAAVPAEPIPTFSAVVEKFIEAKAGDWNSPTHRHQIVTTLRTYCGAIADTPVDEIDTDEVLMVLTPLWAKIPETAARVRNRIERVLAFAQSLKMIPADRHNPARWRGHLENILSAKKKGRNYPALPYADVPAFVVDLQRRDTVVARALEFCLLTATRTNETLGATWSEIDLEGRTWTVPPSRMKGGVPHVVPLSERAVEILRGLLEVREGDYIFPGRFGGRLCSVAMQNLCMVHVRPGYTVHGLRSTFRDWAGDKTDAPREVAEAALAHAIGGVEGRYRRGTALERRARLMDQWAAYCCPTPADDEKVIQFERRA